MKQASRHIERELGRAWERLSEGWRELLSRSNSALTRCELDFPRWNLLSSEIEGTADEVVVRIEAPRLQKSDFETVIKDNMMRISGEKHMEHVTKGSAYHMMGRARGAVHRTFTLPRSVDSRRTLASHKGGVLTVRVPKRAGSSNRTIRVS